MVFHDLSFCNDGEGGLLGSSKWCSIMQHFVIMEKGDYWTALNGVP